MGVQSNPDRRLRSNAQSAAKGTGQKQWQSKPLAKARMPLYMRMRNQIDKMAGWVNAEPGTSAWFLATGEEFTSDDFATFEPLFVAEYNCMYIHLKVEHGTLAVAPPHKCWQEDESLVSLMESGIQPGD